jgi:hypothetical protein
MQIKGIIVAAALTAAAGCSERPPRLHYEPGPSMLTQAYGITPAESARRLNNEQYVGELNTRLHDGVIPGFSALWIQHEPSYAIMVAFTTPPPPRKAVLAVADRSIRNDIVVVTA